MTYATQLAFWQRRLGDPVMAANNAAVDMEEQEMSITWQPKQGAMRNEDYFYLTEGAECQAALPASGWRERVTLFAALLWLAGVALAAAVWPRIRGLVQ